MAYLDHHDLLPHIVRSDTSPVILFYVSFVTVFPVSIYIFCFLPFDRTKSIKAQLFDLILSEFEQGACCEVYPGRNDAEALEYTGSHCPLDVLQEI